MSEYGYLLNIESSTCAMARCLALGSASICSNCCCSFGASKRGPAPRTCPDEPSVHLAYEALRAALRTAKFLFLKAQGLSRLCIKDATLAGSNTACPMRVIRIQCWWVDA